MPSQKPEKVTPLPKIGTSADWSLNIADGVNTARQNPEGTGRRSVSGKQVTIVITKTEEKYGRDDATIDLCLMFDNRISVWQLMATHKTVYTSRQKGASYGKKPKD